MQLVPFNQPDDGARRVSGGSQGSAQLPALGGPLTAPVVSDDALQFTATYRRLHPRALDHATRFVSTADAEDAVGDAFADLWIRWPSLSPEKRADKYVFAAVHYCVYAKLRANGRYISLDEAEPELDARAESAMETPSRYDTPADVLDAAVAALPPRRREVFLLIREQNLEYGEAAIALGLSRGTVNTHMRLAMDQVRTAFARAGFRITDFKPALLPAPQGDPKHV